MPKYPCPVCGDPNAFPIWIDGAPPEGCPEDESWQNGERREVNNVSECAYQRKKAEQAVEWRKQCPEAFDEAGNMKRGGLAMVLAKVGKSAPVIF